MFEKASREKFRFQSPQGALTVEDLWDLPLTSENGNRANLDDIAKDLNRKLKAQGEEESFVVRERKVDDSVKVMFEIVKHVISVRLDEDDKSKKAVETKAKKQKILEIIARKRDAKLEEAPIEDLAKMVEEL